MSRFIPAGLLFTLLFSLLPACVELEGQRIAFFFDEAADKIYLLIHYDGIYDNAEKTSDKGLEQIPEFVENGDIMYADWIGHISMSKIKKMIEEEEDNLVARSLGQFILRHVKVHNLGWFQHFNGQISGTQWVEIANASKLMQIVNGLINAGLLENEWKEDRDCPRCMMKCQQAAQGNPQWIALEGHALRGTFPVDSREWATLKFETFTEMFNTDEEDQAKVAQALSALPLSYTEAGGVVTVRIGDPETPSVLRLNLHDGYDESLVEIVKKHLPAELDARIARAVLEGTEEPALLAIRAWGPPEEKVRALVRAIREGSDAEAAMTWLQGFAVEWNEKQGIPEAPVSAEDTESYLKLWEKWYAAMLDYPG